MMTTKLRTGSFFPALLERRPRVDQCLFAVVMEAYLHGTSTRKVDDMVKALVAPRRPGGGGCGRWLSRSTYQCCRTFGASCVRRIG